MTPEERSTLYQIRNALGAVAVYGTSGVNGQRVMKEVNDAIKAWTTVFGSKFREENERPGLKVEVTPREGQSDENVENALVKELVMTKLFSSIEEMTDEWLTDNQPEIDNEGQIIFYTSMFLWSDGTIHDEPECGATKTIKKEYE